MKKTILGGLLGVVSAVAYGQGHINFSNYATSPYNQIVWSADSGGLANQAVTDLGLQFQFFYGKGNISDASLLTAGTTFSLSSNPDLTSFDPGAGHGPGGYFSLVAQILPDWIAGDTYTFMYKVISPNYFGSSVLWQESDNIVSTGESRLISSTMPGLTVSVPEPSTFALAGLGSAALLLFRRRK